MPLCREAVLGPGVYAGFGVWQSSTVPNRPPSCLLWRRDGDRIGGNNSCGADAVLVEEIGMNAINCPVLGISQVTPKNFVRFWEQLYSGYDEDFYREHIGQPLTEERITNWFKWKNGRRLSARKAQTVRRVSLPRRAHRPRYRQRHAGGVPEPFRRSNLAYLLAAPTTPSTLPDLRPARSPRYGIHAELVCAKSRSKMRRKSASTLIATVHSSTASVTLTTGKWTGRFGVSGDF